VALGERLTGLRGRDRLQRALGTRWSDGLTVVVISAFAIAITLHYGRRGFMPLDQSVVFDGGWRTLSGQVPFRDYTTPNAVTPSLLQAIFFAVLGVTWFAYVLHAAVFNALFSILVYILLRRFGAGHVLATVYAVLSAVIFYPPIGVPFHDQHAFFFVLLAVVLAVEAIHADETRRIRAFWAAAAVSLVLAYLSKQTPALLGAPIVAGLAVTHARRWTALSWLALGLASSIGFLGVLAVALRLDLDLIRIYFFELPALTGRERTRHVGLHELVFAADIRTTPELRTPTILWLGVPAVALVALVNGVARRDTDVLRVLALASAFLVVCRIFTHATSNQAAEGVPLLFAGLGLLHLGVRRTFRPMPGGRAVALALGSLIAVIGVVDAYDFNRDVNARRTVNDMTYEPNPTADASLPDSLSFLRWDVPTRYERESPAELQTLVSRLEDGPGDFFLLGDTTILYGLSGRSSVSPALYLVQRLTIPPESSADFADFERRLMNAFVDHDVRRVVIEPSWQDLTLETFPRLEGLVRDCGGRSQSTGGFTIVELASSSCVARHAGAPAASSPVSRSS
jgi:Dolichyl-phosphate-mannose-protein mannosyltransferase